MGLIDRLAAIAGGRADVFASAPGDRIRYSAMGGVIISTASVAAASAAMAVHMAMGVPVVGAVLIGLAWGVIIFNLDRLLVVQMMRQDKKWVSLVAAAPRVLLALVLGAVISTPVVLQIFRPEIDTELIVMQAERNTEYNKKMSANPEYAKIPDLQAQIKADQSTVDRGAPVDVESDPTVAGARQQYDAAQKAYATAEQNVVCEKEGSCGSGKRGAGIAFREKVQIRDDRKKTRNEAAARLAGARRSVTANLAKAQTTALSAAQARLAANQAQLNDLNTRLNADRRAHEASSKEDNGLLARLEALDRLGDDRPILQTAHTTLFLLFLALELLPVLMKLLQVLGPETRYEREAEKQDDLHAEVAQAGRELTLTIERDIALTTGEAAHSNVQRVVDTRAQVMRMELDDWAQKTLAEKGRHEWQPAHRAKEYDPTLPLPIPPRDGPPRDESPTQPIYHQHPADPWEREATTADIGSGGQPRG